MQGCQVLLLQAKLYQPEWSCLIKSLTLLHSVFNAKIVFTCLFDLHQFPFDITNFYTKYSIFILKLCSVPQKDNCFVKSDLNKQTCFLFFKKKKEKFLVAFFVRDALGSDAEMLF